ncbi:MAG TPA: glucose-1-phosphate adenylyltransferase [Casimicrobiaceae bacterium]|nr:glucose-1-phosphate adenylyltransferase [Casimicrobiaceae bacterium]
MKPNPDSEHVAAAMSAANTKSAVALILAGGRGTRLAQLTDWRAKPSVPFAGKFRIIDFTLSNCVNSGVRRIGVCTQYRAQSLIRHVQRGWSFLDGRFDEFVELLPAQQQRGQNWYRGTADAVYQNLDMLRRNAPRHVLVLAGDHVYKMNYAVMLAEHIARGAQLTVACIEVPLDSARSFGVMAVDAEERIIAFEEKPQHPTPHPQRSARALASMGVYVFDAPFLYEELDRDSDDPRSGHDFGRDFIPSLVARGAAVYAHDFARSCVNMAGDSPYWRDVGTVDAYWEANIALTDVVPELNLYDKTWPIWTYQEQLPPAKFVYDLDGRRGIATDSLVSGGCIVSGSTLHRSLLFSSVHVHSYCTIEESVVLPDVDIGRHVVLKRAVVDRGCRLPPGLSVGVDQDEDRRRFHVTERGVTLVTPDMLGQPLHQRL